MIRRNANDGRYKFQIYMNINPHLLPSPYMNNLNTDVTYITRFRLGSHLLPIETARWSRTSRNERLCRACSVLGDERHYVYNYPTIDRNKLILPPTLSETWDDKNIFTLTKEMVQAELL